MSKFKDYIGDAVYADFDGNGIILTTEDGYGAISRIYMEPEVVRAFDRYRNRIEDIVRKRAEEKDGNRD